MAVFVDFDLVDVEFMRMDPPPPSPVDTTLSFHQFSRLPYELRLDIIEEWLSSRGDTYWTPGELTIVREYGSPYRKPSRRRNPLAEYATINKQWRFAVEKHTFRSLSFVIPEFGRNTSLHEVESLDFYRSSAYRAFDNPDALDDFERICIKERINAVLKLQLSINLHNNLGRPRPLSSLNTIFMSTAGHGDNTDQSIVQIKHIAREAFEKVLRTLECFQESKLKSLYLESESDGLRMAWMADPILPAQYSLHLSQSLYAMTCRLEELTLCYVVNMPHFLAESWAAKTDAPQTAPAWPKLRILRLRDYYLSLEPSGCTREAAKLHDSVTQALPQIPNLTKLYLSMEVPVFVDLRWQRSLETTRVYIEISPRDDHAAMRDGQLLLQGPAPDPETIGLWLQNARRLWDCNLRVGRQYLGITRWQN